MICCGQTREKKPWQVKVKEKEVKVKCSSILNQVIDTYKGYLQGTAILDFMPNEIDSKLSESKHEDESQLEKKSEPSIIMSERGIDKKVFESGVFDPENKDAPTAAGDGPVVNIQVKKDKLFADDLAGVAKQDDSKQEISHLGISQGMLDSFIRQQNGDSSSDEEYDDLGNAKKKRRKKRKDDDDDDVQGYQEEMKKKNDPAAIYNDMLYADVIQAVQDPKANQVSLRNGNRDPRLYNELNVKVGGKKNQAHANEKYLYDDLK